MIEQLVAQGAKGVILGCTEIGLLVQQDDVSIPVFDIAALHAEMASRFILGGIVQGESSPIYHHILANNA